MSSADKPARTVAGLAVVGVAMCCGLPVLLGLGVGVTLAGLGLRTWALTVAGLMTFTLGVVQFRRHRACVRPSIADETEGTGHADPSRPR